jgi:hypothetical protein
MNPIKLVLYVVAGVVAWRLFKQWSDVRQDKSSLRADKPAPALPTSSAILKGRPQVDAAANLPTVNAGSAPLWKWNFETVQNIFANN